MKWWGKDKNTLTLHCYTDRADVYNYFPIVSGKKTVPEWVKKLPAAPKTVEEILKHIPNIKSCTGLLDYHRLSIVLPLWSDLILETGSEDNDHYAWQYSDLKSQVDIHLPEQYGNYFDPKKYQHFKIISPWSFLCSEDINFFATGPEWCFDKLKNINILGGILNFKFQNETHVNLIYSKQKEKSCTLLEADTPLYYFFPLTEKKVEIKNHLVSTEEMTRIRQMAGQTKFNNKYYKNRELIAKRGCPFKFDTED